MENFSRKSYGSLSYGMMTYCQTNSFCTENSIKSVNPFNLAQLLVYYSGVILECMQHIVLPDISGNNTKRNFSIPWVRGTVL